MVVPPLSLFVPLYHLHFFFPASRAEAGIENKALDEDPARAFIPISVTFKTVDFMHAAESSPFAPRNCTFSTKKSGNFHSKFQ